MKEKTLVFFKPDALERNIVNEIYEEFIYKNGFRVISINMVCVSRDLILRHYENNLKHVSKDIISRVVTFYEGKRILILVLEKENAIADFRKILGNSDPAKCDLNTIRGKYGEDSYELADKEGRSCKNIMHASDSISEFNREYMVWFGAEKKKNIQRTLKI